MWRFHRMTGGEENVNPVQGEFFASEDVGDIADSLVRESIQNSLDARPTNPEEPAEVVFSYGHLSRQVSLFKNNPIFETLREHLQSGNSGLGAVPGESEGLDFVCVEDFGTQGLEGDPSFNDLDAPMEETESNDFFYFWRNIGRNRKQSDALGSHGLGKHVFCASSRINTYFGLTKRRSDCRRLLMGKSILNIHHRPEKYAPYGYYGDFDGGTDFALPIEDGDAISAFSTKFSLERTDRPGLSVVIPYPKTPLLTPHSLVRAVIAHFFYPILKKRLKVSIRYPGTHEDINATTISDVARRFMEGDSALQHLLELSGWAADLPKDAYIDLAHGAAAAPQKWDRLEFPELDDPDLRERFRSGDKLAFLVSVCVQEKAQPPRLTTFNAYLWKSDVPTKMRGRFIRQGIDVLSANTSRLDTGVIGLVEVVEHPLASLLRASEPPAHDRWEQRNNPNVTNNYEKGAVTIGFVKDALQQISRRLAKRDVMQDPELLKGIFSVQLSKDEKGVEETAGKKRRRKRRKISDNEVPKAPAMLNTSVIDSDGKRGFRVLPAEEASKTPETITIKIAYHLDGGSPLKNYSPHDFKLKDGPVMVNLSNCSEKLCSENKLVVLVEDPDFRVEVTGFDSERDLFVDVKPKGKLDDSKI